MNGAQTYLVATLSAGGKALSETPSVSEAWPESGD